MADRERQRRRETEHQTLYVKHNDPPFISQHITRRRNLQSKTKQRKLNQRPHTTTAHSFQFTPSSEQRTWTLWAATAEAWGGETVWGRSEEPMWLRHPGVLISIGHSGRPGRRYCPARTSPSTETGVVTLRVGRGGVAVIKPGSWGGRGHNYSVFQPQM